MHQREAPCRIFISQTPMSSGGTVCVGEGVALCRLPPVLSVARHLSLVVRVTISDINAQACTLDQVT
jgi:hypothetical protein